MSAPIVESQNNTNKTSRLAITGFIVSLFSLVPGLVISLVAMKDVKRTGQRGKGFALAGVIIPLISLPIFYYFAAFAIGFSEVEATTGEIVRTFGIASIISWLSFFIIFLFSN